MSEPTAPDRLTFVAHQRPSLPDGDYSISVAQRVSLEAVPFTADRTFTVAGERVALERLLFSADHIPPPEPVPLGELAAGPAYLPAPALGKHDAMTDTVNVIDVPGGTLAGLMPSLGD